MDTTNTPGEGTGLTLDEAANALEKKPDSNLGTTSEVDAESEVEETSTPPEFEAEDNTDELADHDDEGEGEAEDEGTTEDTEAEEVQEEPTFTLRDGSKVSQTELINGYMRNSDYTKKSQANAEQRKQWEFVQQDGQAIRKELGDVLNDYELRLKAEFHGLQAPNLAEIAREDPAYAYQLEKEMERKGAVYSELKRMQHEVSVKEQEYQQKAHVSRQYQAREDISAKYPEFQGSSGDVLLNELAVYAFGLGFSEEQVNRIDQAALIDVLYRAYKGDMYEKNKSSVTKAVKRLEKKPALIMPGSQPQKPRGGSKADEAMKKLKRSGSIDDAVTALLSRY